MLKKLSKNWSNCLLPRLPMSSYLMFQHMIYRKERRKKRLRAKNGKQWRWKCNYINTVSLFSMYT
ncbi:hypothetical protein OESDEN_25219 [Oesophagostomum dentatum]|uniref:Uncharacterized protein n=1 Tax=Oesophagostomum dentatum TaxID=61180 RepID=A0A0B1RVW9_OESDE|nr:hypothetical protein OESDEN_25219 [Oesophagostomum dentatum]